MTSRQNLLARSSGNKINSLKLKVKILLQKIINIYYCVMDYKLPSNAREFVLYQRTELLPKRTISNFKKRLIRFGLIKDNYKNFVIKSASNNSLDIDNKYFSIMKEKADKLLPHIPQNTSSVLDIGCGIAALDLYLYERLNLSNIYLVDRTQTETNIWYMFKQKGAFYNSLDLAKATLELNGVESSKIKLIEAPDDGNINLENGSVDLIISTISWGFHYPVSTYIQSVHNILHDDGILIIDLRKNSDGIEDLEKLFSVEIIEEIGKIQTVKCKKK